MSKEQIHFVTGRLAEYSLRKVLQDLAPRVGFNYSIDVLKITVAALMTPQWIAKRISPPPGTDRIILPGYCHGDLSEIQLVSGVSVEVGPRDLRQLPDFFGQEDSRHRQYGAYDIEILAEINDAPRLSIEEILATARRLADAGAEIIDVGCEPGDPWLGVSDCVKALRDAGHRVSIDSLNPQEIGPAVKAGAELVLSVNSTNRRAALDWGCEVVVVPDDFATLGGLQETIEMLAEAGIPLRIDPILEPIGFGFAASLSRYMEVRRLYPDAEMMMGIGNLTELTEVDSAAINVLLMSICQELRIHSVLTTQVVNWARTSVKECDIARRLAYYAVRNKQLPKHIDNRLVMLRDEKLYEHSEEEMAQLAQKITDKNYRIFAEEDQLHLVSAGLHLADSDPFKLFERLTTSSRKEIDPAHAFYLGYELAKASTALALGKQYQQDESLDWGFLTVPEQNHRISRRQKPTSSE